MTTQYCVDLYSLGAIHIHSFSGLTGKRRIAFRSEQLDVSLY